MIRICFLMLFLFAGIYSNAAESRFVPVCLRSVWLRAELEDQFSKKCFEITAEDIAGMDSFQIFLGGDDFLREGDLSGFKGLRTLSILTSLKGHHHSLPPDLFADLSSLTELSLIVKNVDLQSDALDSLPNLTKLTLFTRSMQLDLLDRIPVLQSLSLSTKNLGNGLWSKLARQTRLRSLFLNGVGITFLDLTVLSEMKQLEELSLANTRSLADLNPQAFAILPKLRKVDLSSLNLTGLDANLGYALRNIRQLNLGHNPIDKINLEFFRALTSLESLILDGTDIKTIPAGAFDTSTNLKTLSLATCGSLEKIEDFAFVNLHLNEVNVFDLSLQNTSKAAFAGVANVTFLSEDFDQDNAEWGGQ